MRRQHNRRQLLAMGCTAVALVLLGFAIGTLVDEGRGGASARASAKPHPGPTRTVAGIPVGYAHSPDGAIAAASNYAIYYGAAFLKSKQVGTTALAAFGAKEAMPKLIASIHGRRALHNRQEFARYGLASAPAKLVTLPAAYRVVSYTEQKAEVAIWGSYFIVGQAGNYYWPQLWSTDTWILKWEDADWKVLDSQIKSGPTPPTARRQPASDGPAMLAHLKQMKFYDYVP